MPELSIYLKRHGVTPQADIIGHLGYRHLSGRALLAAAARIGADLLVMGAHRAEGLKRLLLGKATREVLRTTELLLPMVN
ncbi:MAG: hypothetical protein FD153_844 [Rhodospirillaceae bacterium]|nr:MAG: hypothetical protein FD153_844 [Rhodospirillaceae bacterium]